MKSADSPYLHHSKIGRVGGGDAFSAGFLYGYLNDSISSVEALRWGSACAALKYTIKGDMPLFTYDEVHALVTDKGLSRKDIQR